MKAESGRVAREASGQGRGTQRPVIGRSAHPKVYDLPKGVEDGVEFRISATCEINGCAPGEAWKRRTMCS
jgi:hypothetical protein